MTNAAIPEAPYSQEAEEAVIGAVLINPNAFVNIASFLQPDDFFFLRHKYIWQAMARVHERREAIDPLILVQELREMGVNEEVGGTAYLTQVMAATPSSVHAEVYGRIVERTAIRRRLLATADEIRALALNEELAIDNVTNEAESRLFTVTERQTKREFVTMNEAVNEYFDRIEHLMQTEMAGLGVPSGYRDLDALLGGFQKSDLLIFAGRPGMGKTSFMLSTGVNMARLGARVAIFTMEMGVDQLVQRMISMETGISTQKLRLGQLNQQEYTRFVEAAGRVSRFPIFVDDTPALNPNQMRTKCRRLQHEHGIDIIFVDYLQLMNAGGAYQNNRVQEVSYISRHLKELARELNVPIFSAAQLSRAVEQRQDKRPVLSDLRESGCVTGDSLVYLADEGCYAPIHSLKGKSGYRVMSLNTETYKLEPGTVTRFFSPGVQPVYRMTTALGRTIRATANHKFYTINGWKRLDELTADDHVALPRVTWSSTKQKQSLSDAHLALLGHLIGDGCTLHNHAMQYTTVEYDLAEKVVDFSHAVFQDAVEPRIYKEPGKNWYQVFLKSKQHLTHGVYSPVRLWLESMNIFGLRSYEKHIPSVIFEQPNDAIATFIRHLWATDGCIMMKNTTKSQYPYIYYETSSRDLANGLASLLLRLGITARISQISQKQKGRDQYHVTVSGQHDLNIFAYQIGAVGKKKNAALDQVKAYLQTHIANTNRDVIPKDIWRKYVVPALEENGLTARQFQHQLGVSYNGTGLYKRNVGRDRVRRIANVVQDTSLENLADSDIYWDKIKTIEFDCEEPVYDVTVETNHSYICNDIIISNSLEQDADIVMFLYRDAVYNEATEFPNQADVIVSKHRNGPTGVVSLYFEQSLTKFIDGVTRSVDLGE